MGNVKEEVKVLDESAQLDLEIKRAALEREKQLLRKAELENARLEQDINRLQNAEESNVSNAKSNGASLAASNRDEQTAFAVCTHKKGGSMRVYPRGDGERGGYAIMRCRLPSGDMWIRCLRCGKEWLAPIKPMADDKIYKTAKGFNEPQYRKDYELYKMKVEDYKLALSFNTDNTDAAAPMFSYKDQNAARKAFRGTNPPGSSDKPTKEIAIVNLPGGLPSLD